MQLFYNFEPTDETKGEGGELHLANRMQKYVFSIEKCHFKNSLQLYFDINLERNNTVCKQLMANIVQLQPC